MLQYNVEDHFFSELFITLKSELDLWLYKDEVCLGKDGVSLDKNLRLCSTARAFLPPSLAKCADTDLKKLVILLPD